MKSFAFIFGQDDPAQAVGALIAAAPELSGAYRKRLAKGARLTEDDLPLLYELAVAQPGLRLSLLALDSDDIDENAASLRLGAALMGPGTIVHGPAQGRVRLVARHNGLLVVDAARLAAVNAVPDVSVYTLYGDTPVAQGAAVAEAKITPLAAPLAFVERAERAAAGASPLLDVLPFAPRQAGLIVRERLDAAMAERVAAGLRKKLGWLGSELLAAGLVAVPPDVAAVAAAMRGLLDNGANLLLTAGGSASDPLDPTLQALALLGAEPARVGVPIHPGSLLWTSWLGAIPIVGVPSCGALSEHTSFDIILPRLLALGRAALANVDTLGVGGLLTRGMDHRFPPYDLAE